MMRLSIFYLILLITNVFWGQENTNDNAKDLANKIFFKTNFEKSFQQKIEEIDKTYQGKTKKNIIDTYKNFSKIFVEEIEEGNLYFDSKFEDLLIKIRNKLQNTDLSNSTKNLVSIKKDNSTNAFCLPNGTILVNMGTFDYLANENQLAAVLAHEIGHYYLNHNFVSLEKYFNQNLSAKLNEKFVKKEKYNKSKLALDLLKRVLYENAKNDRKLELEADSIGFVLYKKAGFEVKEYLNAMKKIDEHKTIQDEIVVDSLTYSKNFNLPNQPFDKKWVKNEDFSNYNYDLYKNKIDKDSISTHPEWKYRIEQIMRKFPELKNSNKVGSASNDFLSLKKIANEQRVENLVFSKEYGLAIYLCLFELQKNQNNKFYTDWLGKLFQKLVESYDQYELNNHLVHKNPKIHTKSYLFFLNFMWNLNYNEMKTIANHYYTINKTTKNK